jgi:hypothetical protein
VNPFQTHFPPPPLWLYIPILGLGRLHETFRFISVTRSRTVGRTAWTGDQLVARPLLTDPGDCGDGEVGGMKGFGRGNRSARDTIMPRPFYLQEKRPQYALDRRLGGPHSRSGNSLRRGSSLKFVSQLN